MSGTSDAGKSSGGPTFPLKEHLGFTIEIGEESATASLELDDRHLNPIDVAHGAVAFTLMDTAMGAAVMSTAEEGERCATIEIQIRVHRAATTGHLQATAQIITRGGRIVHLEATTLDDDGNIVATATGSFAILRSKSAG